MAYASRPRKCLQCGPHKLNTFTCASCCKTGVPAHYCAACCGAPAGLPLASKPLTSMLVDVEKELAVAPSPGPDEEMAIVACAPPPPPLPPLARHRTLKCDLIPKPDYRVKAGKRVCRACNRSYERGTRTRVCHRCSQRYCPTCAADGPDCSVIPAAAGTLPLHTAPALPIADAAQADREPDPGERMVPVPQEVLDAQAGRDRFQDLLERITALPALHTILWVPRNLQHRIGDLMLHRLAQAAEAMEAPASRDRRAELQLLWATPALLLRSPAETDDAPRAEPGREAGSSTVAAALRHRATLAENGEWVTLMEEYLTELEDHAERTARAAGREDRKGEVADRAEVLAAAARKVRGGCLRAATQLLRGDKRVPGTASTAEQLKDLTALPVDAEERAATAEEVRRARACTAQVPNIRVRTVRRKLRVIKRAAEPGPSGWRNGMLQLIGDRPTGCEALTRFCRAYSRGALTAEESTLWSSVCLVPLDKGGGKVRPIALGEALPKLAQATLLDTLGDRLRRTFEPQQLSVRVPGGAETLARALRAWTRGSVGRILLQLDLKNAYGRMYRSRTLAAVREKCPALAPQLAQQWDAGATWAWTRVDGVWTTFRSERGGWQGSPDSNPVFCLDLEQAFDEAGLTNHGVARVGYADDTFLDGDACNIEAAWPDTLAALTRHGHEVQPTKSHLWAASDTERSLEDMLALATLSETFPCTSGNLHVMGTEAGQGYATTIGDDAAGADNATERAEAAIEMCDLIKELATADIGTPRLAAAWTLLTKCTARALDYDARLVPSWVLAPVTERLGQKLRETGEMICGSDLDDDQWAQLQLPGPLSGCGLRTPHTVMDPAFWASWATHEDAAREIGRRLGRPGDHSEADLAAATVAANLRDHGIAVERGWIPAHTEEAAAEYGATPWAQDERHPPARPGNAGRYMAGILRLAEGLQAARLWQRSSEDERKRLLSAGGQGTGMLWSALPDTGQLAMPDAHWRIATADRLGKLQCSAGTPCGLPRAAKHGGKCGHGMDSKMRHIWHCKTGVARLRIHNSLVHCLARELRSAQGNVDVERAMPALTKISPEGELVEAIMDLTCWFPGILDWHGIDVTVRFAGATRYVGAATRAGAAAARGEREKHRHYGQGVLPIAMEAGGRMGVESASHLQRLADAAASVTGGYDTRRGLAARWRRRLEAALMFSLADAALCALGKSTGGARTTARWCAQRMQCSDPAHTTTAARLEDACSTSDAPAGDRSCRAMQALADAPEAADECYPVCTATPEDPFALLAEAACHEREGALFDEDPDGCFSAVEAADGSEVDGAACGEWP